MATDSPHDWAARPLLAHRYAWRQRLARHGAATSHAAWDVVLERAVLVEIYGPSFVAACGGVDALAARASQVEMLEHEAIVPLQDFGRWATSFFAAYPQFPDATLQERAAGTPLAVTDVQRLVRRLAGALDTAHAADVVHGHLTPARIVFDTDGRAS
ncbi:MAG: hypothetical protein M0R74_05555, partial [Dehalococcoidia bacterium]|nr:hypothetical protein [Dehalococcoidia bacterium]